MAQNANKETNYFIILLYQKKNILSIYLSNFGEIYF